MYKKAFTLVELVIVIAIIGVMLVLGVVNLRNASTITNDKEREADVANLAIALEDFYEYGNGTINAFDYPSTVQFTDGTSVTTASVKALLPDLDINTVMAPNINDPANTLTLATNNVATVAGVLPQPTIDQYVYQPLDKTGALCTSATTTCTKFYLYYTLENDGLVYQVASRNK